MAPYLPAVLVLRDVIQHQLVSFLDCLPRSWIIVISAVRKVRLERVPEKKENGANRMYVKYSFHNSEAGDLTRNRWKRLSA